MAIGSAVQRGSYVYVYDERGRQLATVPAGHGPQTGCRATQEQPSACGGEATSTRTTKKAGSSQRHRHAKQL